MNKIFKWMLLILIIIILGLFVLFWKIFSRQSSEWKTYNNEEYGINFKYPGDWKSMPKTDADENVFSEWLGTFQTKDFKPVDLFLKNIKTKGVKLSVRAKSPSDETTWNLLNNNIQPDWIVIRNDKDIKIDNQKAKILLYKTNKNPEPGYPNIYDFDTEVAGGSIDVLTKNNTLFSMYFLGENEQSIEILDKILSTVKFTDKGPVAKKMEDGNKSVEEETDDQNIENEVIDISKDWKIYTNDKYGFSFKYPEGLKIEDKTINADEYEIIVKSQTGGVHLLIFPQDLEKDKDDPEVQRIIKLPLKEYAQTIWQMNKDDEQADFKVGNLTTTTAASKIAYQFTSTDSGACSRGDCTKLMLGIMVDNNAGIHYDLNFPSDNDISKKIVETFKFTK